MKRYIAFCLSFVMMLLCIVPVSASASASSMLTVGNVEGRIGDEVIVPILLDNNPGFVSMSLSVTYDTSALTLISCEYTDVISGSVHSANYTSPYNLTWENDIRTSNITSTGTIAYLTFLVSEDAKEQDYSIIVRIPTDGILDANGNVVSASSAMGTITVSAEHECSFGDWEYYSKTKHVRYCDDCDEKEYKNHNWNDGEIIVEPTHEEEGEIEYTCEDCEYSYTTGIDPEGHDWSDWTELNDTQHERTCSCGDSETEAHSWDDGVITKQPTATQAGIRTYTCEDCDASKTESLPPIPVPVTGVTLNKTSGTLKVGNSVSLIANVAPSNATNKNVIWSSSNSSVASVVNGVVTANRAGTATITAKTEDGGFVATCVVTVEAPQPTESATISIDSCEAMVGESIKVNVNLADNPGLASLVLKLSYDQSLLTLTNVEYSTSMGGQTVPPASLTSPVTLYWVNGFANYDGNGVFATLTFTVAESAQDGDIANITVTYNPDDVFNINDENVNLNITAGKVTVIDYVPGDINGDGILNNKDVTRFMQYNAGWDVEVNARALDVNGDGNVNNKDVTRLMQYNAGWDVEIH